jgi:hypothetical protein
MPPVVHALTRKNIAEKEREASDALDLAIASRISRDHSRFPRQGFFRIRTLVLSVCTRALLTENQQFFPV